MQKNTISVIIVVFNSEKYIKKCLDSLENQSISPDQIIIVDNNSTDNTAALCKRDNIGIEYIKNNSNTGFSFANNQGILKANSEWILCLNSDVILESDFIEKFKETIPSLPLNTGGVNPKVFNQDKKTIYANGLYIDCFRRFFTDTADYKDLKAIWGSNAAAAFYKKEMLDDIKFEDEYFDNLFFFLVEDVDLSWRAKNLNWKFFHAPKIICYHTGNCSNHPDKYRSFLSFRNRYYLLLKNESLTNFIKDFIFIFPYDLIRNIYMLFSNKLWFLAVCDIIKNYKVIRKKRKFLKDKRIKK